MREGEERWGKVRQKVAGREWWWGTLIGREGEREEERVGGKEGEVYAPSSLLLPLPSCPAAADDRDSGGPARRLHPRRHQVLVAMGVRCPSLSFPSLPTLYLSSLHRYSLFVLRCLKPRSYDLMFRWFLDEAFYIFALWRHAHLLNMMCKTIFFHILYINLRWNTSLSVKLFFFFLLSFLRSFVQWYTYITSHHHIHTNPFQPVSSQLHSQSASFSFFYCSTRRGRGEARLT